MSNTKAVLGVLEGVMQMPKDSQKTSLEFMAYVMSNGKGIVEIVANEQSRNALLMTINRMASLQPEDRDEVYKFLSSTVATSATLGASRSPIIPAIPASTREHAPKRITWELSERTGREVRFPTEAISPIPGRGVMMEKARQFLGSLPEGTVVSPISICKRAGINPANMYQFCKSLAKQGVLRPIAMAKYKIAAGAARKNGIGMSLLREVASMKRAAPNSSPKLSPRTYLERLPVKKVFKIGAMKATCNIPWNHATAFVSVLMKKGMVRRTARGVYMKVKE